MDSASVRFIRDALALALVAFLGAGCDPAQPCSLAHSAGVTSDGSSAPGRKTPGRIRTPLEGAVVGGDWKAVLDALQAVTPTHGDVCMRFLKGHACLALNRNNDALALFLDPVVTQQKAEWQKWSGDLVSRCPDSAVAHYLEGDAYARCDRWADALKAFDRAVSLDPDLGLAITARASALAATGKWDEAIAASSDATTREGAPADAFATQGVVDIMQRIPDGALRWFNEALKRAPGSVLALNGRGCAYYGLGDWDQAEKDFLAADQAGLPLARINRVALQRARLVLLAAYAKELAHNPGTSIQTSTSLLHLSDQTLQRIQDIKAGQSRMDNYYTPFMYALKGVPWIGGAAEGTLEVYKAQDKYDNQQINILRNRGAMNPGGVTTGMQKAFVDRGQWPVVTWVNLGYTIRPSVGR